MKPRRGSPLLHLEIVLLLAILGFLVGLIAAMVGIGGGVFIVPVLTLVFGFTSHKAVGTSLAIVIFTSLASTYGYLRQKRIDYRLGLVCAVTTVPGALLGALTTSLMSSKMLGTVFAFFLLFVAFRMMFNFNLTKPRALKTQGLWHRQIVDADGVVFQYEAKGLLGSVLSFFGGFFSGLLGIGGGALVVPILNLAASVPIHITVATSMFIMIFTSISGVLTHISFGNVDFEHTAYLALGVIFGAQLGTYVAKRVPAKQLKTFFAVVLIVISLRLLIGFLA